MTINSDIKTVLQQFGIPTKDGIAYLLSMYYDTIPSYIPAMIEEKVKRSGIVSLDEETKLIQWYIPLFNEQFTKFDWVEKEYVSMFADVNKNRKGNVKDSISRMKLFFVENPDVRKDEILGATEMYIKTVKDFNYLTSSHYFIFKGAGPLKKSDLLTWVEIYREGVSENDGRVTHNATMK